MRFQFAPKGWALCDGQLLPLSQNTALFSQLGTTYCGHRQRTLGMPTLQGACPIQGRRCGELGHTQYFPGESGGTTSVTLIQSEIPQHNHALFGAAGNASVATPQSNLYMAGQFP